MKFAKESQCCELFQKEKKKFLPDFGPSREVIAHHRSIVHCHLKVKFKALIGKDKRENRVDSKSCIMIHLVGNRCQET